MDDSEDVAGRNRRETPSSVTHGRAARNVVAPVQEKLGRWQAEAVKLKVMIQRVKAAGRYDPSIAEAARALLEVVKIQTQLLEQALVDLADPVRTHGRVTDTQKVLTMLVERLEEMLVELGEPSGR